jgi:hypothetical protein
MWRLHLERGEYASALSHARDGLQRDKIYAAQAEVAFTAGDYARAATFYAKVSLGPPNCILYLLHEQSAVR